MEKKKFYLISALRHDSLPFEKLKRHDSEEDAIESAEEIIEKRRQQGSPEMGFYILKVETYVGPVVAPIKVVKLK
jgi:hypothetical protein